MNCPECKTVVPESFRSCPACETDIGFPNVRVAAKSENIEALNKRVDEACISAKARKCDNLLKQFGEAVHSSKAVLCRPIGTVSALMKSDNALVNTYYQQIHSKQRLPENNIYDAIRSSVESKLFPNYHEHIHFAFLVLNNTVLEHYGNCGLVLLDRAIQERATVFEENASDFLEKHSITVKQQIPEGYRATWKERYLLAMAKLHPKIDSTKTMGDFPQVLFEKSAREGESDDFIEVHIYGTIHRKSVERVLAKTPRERVDKLLLKSLGSLLSKDGIALEIVA